MKNVFWGNQIFTILNLDIQICTRYCLNDRGEGEGICEARNYLLHCCMHVSPAHTPQSWFCFHRLDISLIIIICSFQRGTHWPAWGPACCSHWAWPCWRGRRRTPERWPLRDDDNIFHQFIIFSVCSPASCSSGCSAAVRAAPGRGPVRCCSGDPTSLQGRRRVRLVPTLYIVSIFIIHQAVKDVWPKVHPFSEINIQRKLWASSF